MKKKTVKKRKPAPRKKPARRVVERASKFRPKVSKKSPARKSVRSSQKPAVPQKKIAPKVTKAEKPIGVVTHFFNHIGVAIVKFSKPVKSGTRIVFRGATTNFTATVSSMQYDHKAIAIAPKGKEIGIRVGKRVREGDLVYPA